MSLAEGLSDRAAALEPAADLPHLSDEAVRGLAAEIDRAGFAVLPNYLGPEALAKLQGFARQQVFEAGGEYIAVSGREAVAGALLGDLPGRPEFVSLLRRLYEQAAGQPPPQQAMLQVLRCVAGLTAPRQSYIFHFDSYVVTLLLPILIPTHGLRGHLIMWPNLRGVRATYLRNLLDKLLVDNWLTQFCLRQLHVLGALKLTKVEMAPGSLYLFWGYRTLHANEPCEPANLRSTALFHFGDPHGASWLRRSLGRVVVAPEARSGA